MRSLARELRAGGFGTITLAFTLSAAHALTPSHGKSVLTACFLGSEARFIDGSAPKWLQCFCTSVRIEG
jgi:ABC-type nickel/cobalt efflux system permease component RcnA